MPNPYATARLHAIPLDLPRVRAERIHRRTRFFRGDACVVLRLLSDDLNKHPFAPPPIELTVEYSLPRAEIELAAGYRHNDFPSHDLPLQMRVAVVLAGEIVPVLADRLMWRKFFEPAFVVVVKARFVVVNEHTRRYVHGIDQTETLLDATFTKRFLDVRRYMDKLASGRYVEP